jgi:hypothetical protein
VLNFSRNGPELSSGTYCSCNIRNTSLNKKCACVFCSFSFLYLQLSCTNNNSCNVCSAHKETSKLSFAGGELRVPCFKVARQQYRAVVALVYSGNFIITRVQAEFLLAESVDCLAMCPTVVCCEQRDFRFVNR